MTDTEKKLYEAIGYTESGPPPEYPRTYEDMTMEFLLKRLVLTIKDDEDGGAVVTKACLNHMTSSVKRRSTADALRYRLAFVHHFSTKH